MFEEAVSNGLGRNAPDPIQGVMIRGKEKVKGKVKGEGEGGKGY